MSGHAVASEYLHNAVTDHRKDIGDYRTERRNTSNPQIRAMVDQTMPVLQTHLALAQRSVAMER